MKFDDFFKNFYITHQEKIKDAYKKSLVRRKKSQLIFVIVAIISSLIFILGYKRYS